MAQGSPIRRVVVNPFEIAAGVSGSLPVFNVQSSPYSAVGDGATDDTAAIRAAATALNAAGRGILLLPPGNYFVYPSGTEVGAVDELGTFIDCNGVSIIGYGATITVDPLRVMPTNEGVMFAFSRCNNIKIDGPRVVGPTSDMSGSIKGIEAFRINGGTTGAKNIDIPNLYVEGMAAAVIVVRDPATELHVENVHIGNLYVKSCYYGVSCQYTGRNVTIDNLSTDKVHRSLFLYGVKGVRANVHSQGSAAADVLINSFGGYAVEDLRLRYSMDDTGAHNGAGSSRVQLQWGDQTPGTFRNLNVDFNVKFGVTSGAHLLVIRKYENGGTVPDALDRGHILDGLRISGYVEGTPSAAATLAMGTDTLSTWSTGDYWYNLELSNFHWKSADVTLGPFFLLGSLVGGLRVSNFYSDKYVRFVQSLSDLRPPYAGRFTIAQDAIFLNKDTRIDASVESMDTITLTNAATDTARAGWSGHAIRDGGATDCTVALPAATVGLEYRFQRTATTNWVRLDPNGAEVIRGGGAGKYLSINSLGGAAHLRCFTVGTWEIVSSNGTIAFEP